MYSDGKGLPTGPGYPVIGPEQPRRNTAPGFPALGEATKRLFRRTFGHRSCVADGILQSDVAGRKNVGMSGAEHEIDLRRPGTDATDRNQRVMGLDGRFFSQIDQIEPVFKYGVADRPEGPDLRSRQPAGLQVLVGQCVDGFRLGGSHSRRKPFPDGVGAGNRHLLTDDDAGQTLEPRRAQAQRDIPGLRDDRAQFRIDTGQSLDAARDVGQAGNSVI